MVKVPLLRVMVSPLPSIVRLRSIVGNAALSRYVQPALSTRVALAGAFAMAWARLCALHGTVAEAPAEMAAASAALPPGHVVATAATAAAMRQRDRHDGNAVDPRLLTPACPVLRIRLPRLALARKDVATVTAQLPQVRHPLMPRLPEIPDGLGGQLRQVLGLTSSGTGSGRPDWRRDGPRGTQHVRAALEHTVLP
jgi:hypothetical protein